MVSAPIPTLAKIKNEASEADARALLYIAICEVCDFFNVGKNMNDRQVALTVDFIIERFWYLKLSEIKYCFRQAMMRDKLFDRLDGNIILGWLEQYSCERAEVAATLSRQREMAGLNGVVPDDSGITLAEYKEMLRRQAEDGDKESAETVSMLEAAAFYPTGKLDKKESLRNIIASEKWFESLTTKQS